MCNQTAMLKRFRDGVVNALFSTSVAEEGLDVQNCSIVVCYDVPQRPLSVVQTMGRARAHNSEVYFMQPVQPWDNSVPIVRGPTPNVLFQCIILAVCTLVRYMHPEQMFHPVPKIPARKSKRLFGYSPCRMGGSEQRGQGGTSPPVATLYAFEKACAVCAGLH